MKNIITFKFKNQVILLRNSLKVINVENPLHISIITKYIKEQRVERITMNVSNVIKLLDITKLFKGMEIFTLLRYPLNVSNVVNAFHFILIR